MSSAVPVIPQASNAQPFNPRLVFGLVAAGVLAFVALVMLLAFGEFIRPGRDGRAHFLSVSAVGYKGLVDLVGNFRAVQMIRTADGFDSVDLVVVALEPQSRPQDLARLLEQRENKTTLIILPKWVTMPERNRPGWVRGIAPAAGGMAGAILGSKVNVRIARTSAGTAEGSDILEGLRVPVPASPQVIEGSDIAPMVALPSGGALVARLGDQPHFILADPDLLNNHGLRDPRNARAALALIDALNTNAASGVNFDLTMNGLGDEARPNLLRMAFEPPFLVMTLALFIAAILAGVHGAVRFGKARAEARAIALGKSALVENSAGLIRLAGREPHLGGAYAELVRQDAARITAAPGWVQGEALDAYLDKLSRSDRPSFTSLAARLTAARDRHELMAAARALFSWKKDIIR
jgi:hypothetical protein